MAKDKKVTDPLAPRASKVLKPAHKSQKSKITLPEKVYKSADRITESDDEDEEMDDAPASQSVTANGADDASSEEEDDDDQVDNEDELVEPGPAPVAAPKPKATPSRSKESVVANGRIDSTIAESEQRPSGDFQAPSGFKAEKKDNISSQADLFRPKNLSDKEIWYISAPASLPITALKEVALEKFARQQALMTHDGEHYTLVSDPAARHATRVLLPEKQRGYTVIPTPVKHVLQFQQILNVQATASKGRPKTTSQVLLDTDIPTKPFKKPQPQGMKMRFRPSGFGDGFLGTIGSSDEEEENLPSPSTFRKPPGLSSSKGKEAVSSEKSEKKKKKKDKRANMVTPADVEETHEQYVAEATTAIDADQETAPPEAISTEGKKKKKKDKQGVENATGMEPTEEPVNGEPISVEGTFPAPDDSSKSRKEKKKNRKEADADARAINGTAEEQALVTAEDEAERKRRKQERKEKKRAKREAGEA